MRILIYLILLLYPFNLISGQKKQKRLSDDELMTLVQKQTFRYFGILPILNPDWRMNGVTVVPRQLPLVGRDSE